MGEPRFEISRAWDPGSQNNPRFRQGSLCTFAGAKSPAQEEAARRHEARTVAWRELRQQVAEAGLLASPFYADRHPESISADVAVGGRPLGGGAWAAPAPPEWGVWLSDGGYRAAVRGERFDGGMSLGAAVAWVRDRLTAEEVSR
jgi:hypothetical protein